MIINFNFFESQGLDVVDFFGFFVVKLEINNIYMDLFFVSEIDLLSEKSTMGNKFRF
jgi:hypothetical protein